MKNERKVGFEKEDRKVGGQKTLMRIGEQRGFRPVKVSNQPVEERVAGAKKESK